MLNHIQKGNKTHSMRIQTIQSSHIMLIARKSFVKFVVIMSSNNGMQQCRYIQRKKISNLFQYKYLELLHPNRSNRSHKDGISLRSPSFD